MMILVVVGLDGLGKTPLINLIKNEFDHADWLTVQGYKAQIVHVLPDARGKTHKEVMDIAEKEVLRWDNEYKAHLPGISSPDVVLLCDRFPFPDDWVYRPEGITKWTEFMAWDQMMLERDVRFLLIDAWSTDDYIERVREHAKHTDEYQPVLDRYWVSSRLIAYEAFALYTRCRILKLMPKQFTREDARDVIDFMRVK